MVWRRDKIIKEEGDGYNEYFCSMFRVYLSCKERDFVDTVKDERRKWTQGKLGLKYLYRELMDLWRWTYSNILDEYLWNAKLEPKSKDEKSYLALPTALMTKMSDMNNSRSTNRYGSRTNKKGYGERAYLPWRFDNPGNAPTKFARGSIMKWCKNDCHKNQCGAVAKTTWVEKIIWSLDEE